MRVDHNKYDFTISAELKTQLEEFCWQMRGLLGGDLLAIVMQTPSWILQTEQNPSVVNIVVLVSDPVVAQSENIFRQQFLREYPRFNLPIDITGYNNFLQKIRLGDPSVIHLCVSGSALYESGNAFDRLKDMVKSGAFLIQSDQLREYLTTKSQSHFRNVGFMLARLLSEVYMGAMSALTVRLLQSTTSVGTDFLDNAATWKTLKSNLDASDLSPEVVSDMDLLAVNIASLISTKTRLETTNVLGSEIIKLAYRLAQELGGSKSELSG